ncbi:uncharacterized protein LOC129794124 isoform X1 [Lutzomyia longipalpis]|uniref:uncharacterized protein LOC129794124 isoform X1 n=1 Tax=Lutzomyia longipalpis TaxID=7200 RepID=UPI0024835FB4|nr:uncharacterized protein LOC129794124 isoform X1 [Lutzomyia longipalpis]
MAPFKLKFRMGSSRSTSQETTAEPDVTQTHQQPLLGSQPTGSSTTTIDTVSLGSMSGDSRALLHNSASASGRLAGYENPTLQQNFSDSGSVNRNSTVPLSPPPSYEHVLEEISKITTHMEMLQNRLAALDKDNNPTNTPANWTYCSGTSTASCTTMNENCTGSVENCPLNDTEESLDSPIYTCSTMTTPSQENLLTCTGSCDPLYAHSSCQQEGGQEQQQTECQTEVSEDEENNSDVEWNSHEHQQQQMRIHVPQQSPEILSNKSSKELYKAVAKQYGITCEMSSSCKCLECACHYFDCEYEENDHQKTDGGLGAGTPMFISEVMHGTACVIL